MASGKLLRQLIKSGVEGDSDSFRQVSEAVIKEERLKQHTMLANDLERILYGSSESLSSSTQHQLKLVQNIPLDKERNLPLVEMKEPVRGLDDLVLTSSNIQLLEQVLNEYNREELLRSWGMRPVERILFCGPPGCGKTLSAEVLAYEMGRPLCIVRLDSVVSSFLGETSANLRKVLDFTESMPMVVLFDEFDALAKERSNDAEHSELKRVVNTFLQMLDGYQGPSLIIAATNHESMLDSAIWRRFEEVVVFSLPNITQIKKLLGIKLRGVRREFDIKPDVINLFKSISHSDIERILRRAIKDMVLSGKEFLQITHLKNALKGEKGRKQRLSKIQS